MSRINLLSDETINAIAAGEVVERPSSVVKELVENSLDAGADAVSIEIKGGGIDMIRVTDNGCGIDADDIKRAFERHATSKIESAEDLIKVATLGFRGEALSSIAAVSLVELLSRTKDEVLGRHYITEGGTERTDSEAACPQGTTIIVSNLFYNTPARRKFLKSASAEGAAVAELMQRLALSRPDVSFTFINNGKTALHSYGNNKPGELIYRIYGRDVERNLLEIEKRSGIITISGFTGKPILSRGNRSWENYFINSRFIKNDTITKAIEDAYKTFVMIHKFPFTALYIDIAPELIDVNIHPRKMELKLHEAEEVYSMVYETLRDVLTGRELLPQASLEKQVKKTVTEDVKPVPEPFEVSRLTELHGLRAAEDFISSKAVSEAFSDSEVTQEFIREEPEDYEGEALAKQPEQKPVKYTQESFAAGNIFDPDAGYRMIGQVFGTYWMMEFGGKLYILDQHAAHEKVLYERFKRDFEEKKLAAQHVAPPVIISLSPSQEEMLKKYNDVFSKLCFEVEHFGGRDYAIYAVPMYLFEMNIKDIFIEILDSMKTESSSIEGSAITWRIAEMACKAAVKGNSRISVEEAKELMRQLSKCENPYNCPHGRPTLISLSRYEFDKRFKRIQD